tara:strand:- start:118 stop:300 length:183 start_codon:yes stop_codon:yes gene_type:complete
VHPLIIMTTVPLAVLGALIGLLLTDNSLNIYSNTGSPEAVSRALESLQTQETKRTAVESS